METCSKCHGTGQHIWDKRRGRTEECWLCSGTGHVAPKSDIFIYEMTDNGDLHGERDPGVDEIRVYWDYQLRGTILPMRDAHGGFAAMPLSDTQPVHYFDYVQEAAQYLKYAPRA